MRLSWFKIDFCIVGNTHFPSLHNRVKYLVFVCALIFIFLQSYEFVLVLYLCKYRFPLLQSAILYIELILFNVIISCFCNCTGDRAGLVQSDTSMVFDEMSPSYFFSVLALSGELKHKHSPLVCNF